MELFQAHLGLMANSLGEGYHETRVAGFHGRARLDELAGPGAAGRAGAAGSTWHRCCPSRGTAPSTGTTAGAPAPKPIPEQAEHQVRAQSLLGVDVSNGQDTIGEVSDLVVTDDGRVEAIVVGVGGFLGIGEKPVALAWDSIKLTEQDGSRVILVSATREQLEGMPTYKTLEDKQAEADAAAAQQQMQQQQQGVVPSPGVAPPRPLPRRASRERARRSPRPRPGLRSAGAHLHIARCCSCTLAG